MIIPAVASTFLCLVGRWPALQGLGRRGPGEASVSGWSIAGSSCTALVGAGVMLGQARQGLETYTLCCQAHGEGSASATELERGEYPEGVACYASPDVWWVEESFQTKVAHDDLGGSRERLGHYVPHLYRSSPGWGGFRWRYLAAYSYLLPFTSAHMDDCDSPAENGRPAGIPDGLHAALAAGLGPRWFVIVAWTSVGPDLCLFLHTAHHMILPLGRASPRQEGGPRRREAQSAGVENG